MPSYLHNRPAGSDDDPPRPHHRSQYNNSGGTQPAALDSFNAVAQRSMGQQQPAAAHQGSNNASFIPPPVGFTYQATTFQCTRCQEQFDTREGLDRHSIACGAAALLTGYFTPYPVAQAGYGHSASQPHGQSPHGASGSQSQNKRRRD